MWAPLRLASGSGVVGLLLDLANPAANPAAGTTAGFMKSFGNVGGGAYSQDFELEADYVGLYMAARAEYDVDAAANFMRRLAAVKPDSIDVEDATHPNTAHRFVALETAALEIQRKRNRRDPLIPNEK